jgi:hypothetical protein
MGVYNYIPKRTPKKFLSADGPGVIYHTIYPLGYSNKMADEHNESLQRLKRRHRMCALAWEQDFESGNVPLVTVVGEDFCQIDRKWEPTEGAAVYEFTGGNPSGALPKYVFKKEWYGAMTRSVAARGADVPCFWYDCNNIGRKIGTLQKIYGEWRVIPCVVSKEPIKDN